MITTGMNATSESQYPQQPMLLQPSAPSTTTAFSAPRLPWFPPHRLCNDMTMSTSLCACSVSYAHRKVEDEAEEHQTASSTAADIVVADAHAKVAAAVVGTATPCPSSDDASFDEEEEAEEPTVAAMSSSNQAKKPAPTAATRRRTYVKFSEAEVRSCFHYCYCHQISDKRFIDFHFASLPLHPPLSSSRWLFFKQRYFMSCKHSTLFLLRTTKP